MRQLQHTRKQTVPTYLIWLSLKHIIMKPWHQKFHWLSDTNLNNQHQTAFLWSVTIHLIIYSTLFSSSVATSLLLCAKRSVQGSESPIYFTISDAVVNLISFMVRKRFLFRKSKVNTTWSTYTKLINTWWITHSGLVEGFVDTKNCQELCSHGRRISWFRLRSSRRWVFCGSLHQPNIIVPTKCMVFFRIHSRSDRQYLHNLDGVVPKRNVFYNQLVHCKLGI